MQKLPVPETKKRNYISIPMRIVNLDQLDVLINYLKYDWKNVQIIDSKSRERFEDIEEFKKHYPKKIKSLTLRCVDDSDHADYEIVIQKGKISVIQLDETNGEKPLEDVKSYFSKHQRGLDKHPAIYGFSAFAGVVVVIGLSLYFFSDHFNGKGLLKSLGTGILIGIFPFGFFLNLRDYTACVRIEGRDYWERNKDWIIVVVTSIATAISTVVAMKIFNV